MVRVRGAWFYAIGATATFILDYPAYDPSYVPGRYGVVFRDGLDVVTPADGFRFLHALGDGVAAFDEIRDVVAMHGLSRTRPQFLIDFDSALFVSAFFDQALEDEAGPGWSSSYTDPMEAAPAEFQEIWPAFNA